LLSRHFLGMIVIVHDQRIAFIERNPVLD